jgi:hypothetical protein
LQAGFDRVRSQAGSHFCDNDDRHKKTLDGTALIMPRMPLPNLARTSRRSFGKPEVAAIGFTGATP